MKVIYRPYVLILKHPFTISGHSRTATPVMLVELLYEGLTGYGEASMVPYMGESFDTANSFLSKLDLSWLKFPFDYDEVLGYLDAVAPNNPSVKAAIDMALHDLHGKLDGLPCYRLFNSDPSRMPVTSITLGIDSPEVLSQKIREAESCKVLKVKLGSDDDKALIRTVRTLSDKPLYVDANQGWTSKEAGLDMAFWLQEQGVILIEQPMKKDDPNSNAWITERSPLPILGDEAVQRYADIEKAAGVYHGINIKLMKSAGMHEGFKMIKKARSLGMSVLIGCMSETSIATLAAAALAPLCDWADLDGPFLTGNNPYPDPAFVNGKWILSDSPGLGLSV